MEFSTSSKPVQNASTSQKNNLEQKKAFTLNGRPTFLFSSLPYYFLYALYFCCFIALKYHQNPYWILAIAFLGIPLLDYFSHDWLNPNSEQYKELEQSIWFKIPLIGLVLIDNVFVAWAVFYISTNSFPLIFYPGALYIVGALTGSNFLIAHELFHKRGTFNRVLGSLTMAKNLYMHFYIEHNYGHHKNVATPLDPATSRLGESLFHFLPRTIIGGYKSAWNIEKKRLVQFNGHSTHWVPQNKMIWFSLNNILFPSIVCIYLGLKGLFVYLIVAGLSIIILETINYIEHYGLERKQIGLNEYEKVTIEHSWNAPQRFSNYLLFKLQRHSDHHENSYKPYQVLLSKDESPMLPHGYTLCLILSNFPSVWFKMMERSFIAYKEKRELTKEEVAQTDREAWIIFSLLGLFFFLLFFVNCYYNEKI